MPEIALNDGNFEEEVVKSELPVLVNFWAPWCVPCSVLAPVLKEIALQYEGQLKVCKLNVDEGPRTASRYGIMSIPTLAIFKDGTTVDAIIGPVPKRQLEEKLTPHI